MKNWITQLLPIIEEFKDGDNTALDSEEVEKLSLIIRLKIDVHQGNISDKELEVALNGDLGSILNTLH